MNLLENIDSEKIKIVLNDDTNNFVKGVNTQIPNFINMIEDFTLIPDNYTKEELLKNKDYLELIKHKTGIEIKNIRYSEKNSCYRFFTLTNNILFDKLSNNINNEEMKKELTSYKRYGKCHVKSMELSKLYPDSSVVTGFITVGKSRILHSVLKITHNNNDYVIDYTKNLIMLYKDYKKIYKYVVLTDIKDSVVKHDLESIDGYGINSKLFLAFHDEIMENYNNQR